MQLSYRNHLQVDNYTSLVFSYQHLLHQHMELTTRYYQLEKEHHLPQLHSPASKPSTPTRTTHATYVTYQ
jgi:hypothetical protein